MSFRQRSATAERMDTDCADFDDYRRCLGDLARVNRVTFTARPTLAWLAGQGLRRGERIAVLDVAAGYGDMLRAIRRFCRRRGVEAELTGIDLNPWAVEAARRATPEDDAIEYRHEDVFAYRPTRPVDFIVSAQFAHHLTDEQIIAFLRWMEATARRGWLISDLQRSPLAYWGFGLLASVMLWHRFVRSDGMISITRGFRSRELLALADAAGAPARVRRHVPFRLTLERGR